jgi:hypothetical protein
MATTSRRQSILALLAALFVAVLLASIAADAVPNRPSIKKASVKKTYLQANVW